MSKIEQNPISVFARVRPLTPAEVGSDILPGLKLDSESSRPNEATAVVLDSATPIDGYTGVLGQESTNQNVFDLSFTDRISTVLRGGTASLFCYGYTGAGKTHTVIGYGEEKGMFFLAAERLLRDLKSLPSGDDGIFLRATACEIYNDKIFDLLGSTKLECTLATNEAGQLQILGPPERTHLDASEAGIPEELRARSAEMHATIVQKPSGLRCALVKEPHDLDMISNTCVKQRACGSSTEHHQSSRSHAILRLDVVNAALAEAQDAVNEARAVLPARKNALDNVSTSLYHLLWERVTILRLGEEPPFDHSVGMEGNLWKPESDPGWIVDREITHEDSDSTYCLKGFSCEAKTATEWAQHLGVRQLKKGYGFVKKIYDEPGTWDSKKVTLIAQQDKLSNLVKEAQKDLEVAEANLLKIMNAGPSALGGSLLLVDLAGADYDHRTGSQQKESAAINKSLLALKECFRSLAKVSPQRPKFRDSKLTRVLEDSLSPTASSGRFNKESVSVMIVNVSPAARFEKMTINGLRYGQMFAGSSASAARTSSAKSRAAPKPSSVVSRARTDGKAVTSAGVVSCDSNILKELRSIYKQFSDKDEAAVEKILTNFSGREQELLSKVREKYLGSCGA